MGWVLVVVLCEVLVVVVVLFELGVRVGVVLRAEAMVVRVRPCWVRWWCRSVPLGT